MTLSAALLALSGCAGELVVDRDGALAVIPRQIGDTGHILVDVMLNGRGPFEFALDTGASISVVFERCRSAARIDPAGDETVYLLGVAGAGRYPLGNVARVSIGSETWDDARLALMPSEGPVAERIDGILGLDFLSRYAVHSSRRERVIRLYPRALVAERSFRGWSTIPLIDLHVGAGDLTMPGFDIHIDAERVPALFDLGATVNLMNRSAARRLNITVRRPRDVPEVWGVTGDTQILTELIVRRLRIANMHWRNRTFLIGDFPVFEALGIDSRPAAIAGTEVAPILWTAKPDSISGSEPVV